MALTMNEIYGEILKEGGMTPSKKSKTDCTQVSRKSCNEI